MARLGVPLGRQVRKLRATLGTGRATLYNADEERKTDSIDAHLDRGKIKKVEYIRVIAQLRHSNKMTPIIHFDV
jgi:hypothetical protein